MAFDSGAQARTGAGVAETVKLLSGVWVSTGVLTTCEINTIEEGEDVLDLAALATAFRRTPEVKHAQTSSCFTDTRPYMYICLCGAAICCTGIHQ